MGLAPWVNQYGFISDVQVAKTVFSLTNRVNI
jgi:hypothetical protein